MSVKPLKRPVKITRGEQKTSLDKVLVKKRKAKANLSPPIARIAEDSMPSSTLVCATAGLPSFQLTSIMGLENGLDKEDSMEFDSSEDLTNGKCEDRQTDTPPSSFNWQIGTNLSGGASVVKAPLSDVQLHVPEGIHGVLLGNIHTNHARFRHHIPDDHCILGPICEYQYFPSPEVKQENSRPFRLLIPHIIDPENIEQKKDKIRVRCGNIHNLEATLVNVPLRTEAEVPSFEVDNEFIIIHTSHFCGYIVTAEGLNCCAGAVQVSLFGKLDNSLSSVKVCFSSLHNQIDDYKQMLKDAQALFDKFPIDSSVLTLSTSEYDASKSTMEITLEPEDNTTWKPVMDSELRLIKKLNEVFKFVNGHLCRGLPITELSDFVLKSSQPNVETFVGKINISLRISISSDENRNQHKPPISMVVVVKDTKTANSGGLGGSALPESFLMKLAKKIEKTSDLVSLGLELGVPSEQVKIEIKNNPGDWVMAAFEVLKKWLISQGNPDQAIKRLRKAQRDSGIPNIIS